MLIFRRSFMVLTCLVVTIVAQETKERLHSVKKAIGNVLETPQKELTVVDGFAHMFNDGRITGQVRSIFSSIDYLNIQDTYVTALGGYFKYELAQYQGFSATIALRTSHDIYQLSGKEDERNPNLSSSAGSYSKLTQASIDYSYEGLDVRIGRQIIDTPLADSDDIRMIANSFEAYVLNYEIDNITLMLAHLLAWQGYDANLDEAWIKTGENGTNFVGIVYSDSNVDTSIWYYNVNGKADDFMASNSIYMDAIAHLHVNNKLFLHVGMQYLNQGELNHSGVSAHIYGLTSEVIYNNIGINLAYNKSLKHEGKKSFSGFGGGTLFTNMDSMILDHISEDRDVSSWVGGVSYKIDEFSFLYAYGDFLGEANSRLETEHIIEQDAGIEYLHNDNLTLALIYTKNSDLEDSNINDGSWENMRMLLAYNF